MTIYCTYLTIYSGNKLPPFYIGSSSVDKVMTGYHGSIKSKYYKEIWCKELKDRPELFKTKIISNHETRKDALAKELFLQKSLNVVQSNLYINMAYATVDGFFGRNVKGNNHPNFGKKKEQVKWFGISRSKESIERYRISKTGGKNPMATTYLVYDNNQNLVYTIYGKFDEYFKQLNFPLCDTQALRASFKNNLPVYQKLKSAKTGPIPKLISKNIIGWCVIRILDTPWKQNNVTKNYKKSSKLDVTQLSG